MERRVNALTDSKRSKISKRTSVKKPKKIGKIPESPAKTTEECVQSAIELSKVHRPITKFEGERTVS
jgi:hypothetical protein